MPGVVCVALRARRLSRWRGAHAEELDQYPDKAMHNVMDFLIKHGHIVIFVAVFIEQIGLPVPSGPVLVAAGALVGFHRLSLAPVVLLAVAASLICDSLWFCLGRRRGV